MTPNFIDTDITYRIAIDHQAALRAEAADRRVVEDIDRRTGAPLPPTKGPLATLRRRLAGKPSFA